MTDRSGSSRWWYLIASALTVGVLLLPFVRVPWTHGSSVSDPGSSVVWALALVSVGLSASLYLDARRIGSRDWRPSPRLYAVGGALYPLSLVIGVWYLSERQWHVGLLDTGGESPSDGDLVASRWHYWIALGPVWCLVGAVAAVSPLGLTGLLIGALCWIVGFGTFVLAINVDVRKVRAAELDWTPGVGRYTYTPLLAVFSLALAPLLMLVVGGVYLFQRRRHLRRAARSDASGRVDVGAGPEIP